MTKFQRISNRQASRVSGLALGFGYSDKGSSSAECGVRNSGSGKAAGRRFYVGSGVRNLGPIKGASARALWGQSRPIKVDQGWGEGNYQISNLKLSDGEGAKVRCGKVGACLENPQERRVGAPGLQGRGIKGACARPPRESRLIKVNQGWSSAECGILGQRRDAAATLLRERGGAGEGNRTLVASLEDWSSTIELHPQRKA
jgi:hypothetical protein